MRDETLLAIADLSGRTLHSHAVLTPTGDADDAIGELAEALRELVGRFSGRRFLWAGVAVGGNVDETTGSVDHPVRGWRGAAVGAIVHDALGLLGNGVRARAGDGRRRTGVGCPRW